MDRKELLRRWLRDKGFHPTDIKIALTWYSEMVKQGKDPKDDEVYQVADRGHSEAVGLSKPSRIIMNVDRDITYNIAMSKIIIGSIIGSFCGGLVWVLTLMLLRL